MNGPAVHEPSAASTSWRVALPHTTAAVPVARALVRTALAERKHSADSDTAELLTAELVANAVEHTGTNTVGVSITRTGEECVRIVVTDASRVRPNPVAPAPDDEHGRGLLLVEMLAHAWGCEPVADGKRVWAELRAGGER